MEHPCYQGQQAAARDNSAARLGARGLQPSAQCARTWHQKRFKMACSRLLQHAIIGEGRAVLGTSHRKNAAESDLADARPGYDLAGAAPLPDVGGREPRADARTRNLLRMIVSEALTRDSERTGAAPPARPPALFIPQRSVLLLSRYARLEAAELAGGMRTVTAHIQMLLANRCRPHEIDIKLLDHYEVGPRRARAPRPGHVRAGGGTVREQAYLSHPACLACRRLPSPS